MANVLVEEQTLTDIANAIREKNGTTDKMKPGAMVETIANLPSGGGIENGIEYLEFDGNGNLTKAKYYGSELIRYAFSNQSALQNVELSNDVTYIGPYAFRYCPLNSLTKLPNSLTKIGTNAFYGASNMSLTELPNEIIDINSQAFYSCRALALTKLPSKLTRLKDNVFNTCTGLVSMEIHSGIVDLDSCVFESCTNLKNVTFKGTPSSIRDSVFRYCNQEMVINVPWAEGEVANAPWGATNATINYNYVAPESEA